MGQTKWPEGQHPSIEASPLRRRSRAQRRSIKPLWTKIFSPLQDFSKARHCQP
ncbi:hypothetical protein [Thermosynechococcus sp.]|uniref:hypothetical protein n=1 Tax=Thermosynechococcus sp. TaxID=2814275 RepID=UPI00262E84BA|nr:hypothetical protein [Thermosynechococcus sp.]